MEDKFINQWKIIDQIETGGFSTIYKVSDDNNNIYVIKKLDLPLSDDLLLEFLRSGYLSKQEMNDYALSQIQKEISILERYKDNENILKLYEVKEEKNLSGKSYYLRMEYATNIKKHFSKNNFTDEEIIKMSIDICSALEELEKNNIVHTDIKPGNIFISENKYKLGDFGSSVEINKEVPITIFGTMNYMAPEIYKKQKVDFSTDIYSLGLVMYSLLNGNLPFVSSTTPSNVAFEKRMNGEKIMPIFGIKEKLMNIIIKACSFDKENRYKNATEMKEALIDVISNANNVEIKQVESPKQKIMGILTPQIHKQQNEEIINNYTPIESEPTISIYDTELLNINRKNAIDFEEKKKKKRLKISINHKIKKYLSFILLFLLIPGGIYANYAINKTCDEGYINVAGRCLKGKYTCPEEYTLNKNNKCQKVKSIQEAKITKKCIDNENYYYDEKTNLCKPTKVVQMQQKPTCVIDGFQYNTSTKKCERTEVTDAYPQYSCSKDYNLVGDTCVKEQIDSHNPTVRYTCPSGYSSSGSGASMKCSKNVTQSTSPTIDYSCPDGYTLSGETCTKTTNVEYNWYMPSCPSGCSFKGSYYSSCECKTTATKTPVCLSGYTLNSSKNQCTKTTKEEIPANPNYECKSTGYVYNPIDGKCYNSDVSANVNTIKAKVNYICVTGGRINNKKCYTTISQDPVTMPSCPDGYETNGVVCVPSGKDHPPVIKYSCSRAYTLNEGRCEIYTYKPATPVFD